MIDRDEINSSLTGAWKIFLDRPDALTHFDTSYAGFWRSFQAIFLIIPLYAVAMLASWRMVNAATPPGQEVLDGTAFFWSRVLSLGLDWITLPAILALLAGTLGISRTYTSYVVARNWSNVLIAVPYALIGALEIAFASGGPLVMALTLLVLAAALRFAYLVARKAMQVNQVMAISIVALDFFLSMFITVGVGKLLGLPLF